MLWAAFCMGFFGLGAQGNSQAHYPKILLSVADVAMDSGQNPQILTVLIHRSKTDQSGTGSRLYLGRTGRPGSLSI